MTAPSSGLRRGGPALSPGANLRCRRATPARGLRRGSTAPGSRASARGPATFAPALFWRLRLLARLRLSGFLSFGLPFEEVMGEEGSPVAVPVHVLLVRHLPGNVALRLKHLLCLLLVLRAVVPLPRLAERLPRVGVVRGARVARRVGHLALDPLLFLGRHLAARRRRLVRAGEQPLELLGRCDVFASDL